MAFDPGKSTGYARVDFNRFYNRIDSVTLSTIQIDDLKEFVGGISDLVLIEEPPAMAIKTDIVWIAYDLVRNGFRNSNVETIFPSQWKPVARARKWSSSGTRHEKDAYNIIRWYIFKTFKEDIGE